MFLSILAAQFPVSLTIQNNLDQILAILNHSKKNDLVVFPEGSISGYDTNISFLEQIDMNKVNNAMKTLKTEAKEKKINLWVGSCLFENGNWFNVALGFTPDGKVNRYNKVNLAIHERGTFTFGSELNMFPLEFNGQIVNVGVQMCRDLKYPEQWRWLAMKKAQIFLHLNNAIKSSSGQSVWKSQLVSRATENQRFVISVNAASITQECPTIAINPQGEILNEICSSETQYFRLKIDLDLISDWYIKQSRCDLIKIKYIKNTNR
ncbi:MAG: carbon-nitrogen hydrolase family protein [Candidatus Thorarchaeota archaeon]